MSGLVLLVTGRALLMSPKGQNASRDGVILLKASYLKKVYLQQYLQINANTLLAFNICTHLLLLSRKNVE